MKWRVDEERKIEVGEDKKKFGERKVLKGKKKLQADQQLRELSSIRKK